jgi:riboflavin-specific deaminase-like protein
MRQLLPELVTGIDPFETYAGDTRSPVDNRPWVLVNMVTSLDGATSIDERSGGLGGDADRQVFRSIRAVADVILVGAGTARAEQYRSPSSSAEVIAARRLGGQSDAPRLAIVSRRLELVPHEVPALATDAPPTIVVTTSDAPADHHRRVALNAEVLVSGTGSVDPALALRSLRERHGFSVVVCEGGPALNATLADADLIDEVCLTIDPTLVGGPSHRLVHGSPQLGHGFELRRVIEADGVLLLRYTRRRPA